MFSSVNQHVVNAYELSISPTSSENNNATGVDAFAKITNSPTTLARQSPLTTSLSEMKFLTYVDSRKTFSHLPHPDDHPMSEPEPDYDDEPISRGPGAASTVVQNACALSAPQVDIEQVNINALELMLKTGLEPHQLVNDFQQAAYIKKQGLRNDGVCTQLTFLWLDENTRQTGFYEYIASPTGMANIKNLIEEEQARFDFLAKSDYKFSKQSETPEAPGKYLIDLSGDNHVAALEISPSGSVRFFDSNCFELCFKNSAEFDEFLSVYLIAADYKSDLDRKNVTFYKLTTH